MEILQIQNLEFTYPASDTKALDGINLSVNKGDFILLCGESGCGKTTLLQLLKKEIAPYGTKKGSALYNGKNIFTEENVFNIGYVMQNPNDQIVTDRVWHELAFGLENMGLKSFDIRRRVAEIASYFGMEEWYEKSVDELSGGQKQLLCLASVMVMQPKLLLLDEPTAQLDPIAASDFISTVKKLNNDFGITVIIAEHRLEELFPLADRVVALQNGKKTVDAIPVVAAEILSKTAFSLALPTAVKIYNALNIGDECPLTVREGRTFLENNFSNLKNKTTIEKNNDIGPVVLSLNNIRFKFEKGQKDILKGIKMHLTKGEIFSLMGGNGAGKSTLLNIISKNLKPYTGKIKFHKKDSNIVALLPQEPKYIFTEETVLKDFNEVMLRLECDDPKSKINYWVKTFKIEKLLNMHPYDLSGGELQKCAIVKLLLTGADILLLDEPTKGMDPVFKKELFGILKKLSANGKTIMLVTHDTEFAAEVSDRCGLLFNGELVSVSNTNEFFSFNRFYTTAAVRISAGILNNTVTCNQIIDLCKES